VASFAGYPDSPAERYRQLTATGSIVPDPHQLPAVSALESFYLATLAVKQQRRFTFLSRSRPVIQGLYLAGGVGRGKTWLMDLLYESLPVAEKKRQHFHAFMQDIHQRLKQHEGQADPLLQIAKKLSVTTRVLFLDEFHIVDIADAMILAQLLRGLFSSGIALVTTSNVHPENLYNEGIQRASFLPAIDLLQKHTRVIHIGGSCDYRSKTLEQMPIYLVDESGEVTARFDREFSQLTKGQQITQQGEMTISNRTVQYIKKAGEVAWFGFKDLCLGPRNAGDFLEIARSYHTLFIEGVPVLDGSRDDWARRFILMIDIFYDHRVKLVIAADAYPENLYNGERLAFEFKRTASRLLEMQSAQYLSMPHRL